MQLKNNLFCRWAIAISLSGTSRAEQVRWRERSFRQYDLHRRKVVRCKMHGMRTRCFWVQNGVEWITEAILWRERLFSQQNALSFQGEEFAGSPLMCQAAGEWHLVGISAWRKGCSSIANRPRLYDKVSLNSEWAKKTIQGLEKEEGSRTPKKNQWSAAM